MPDFTGLRAAAEDAVRQPEFAAVAHRAARLRRRNHITAGGAAAVLVSLTAVTAGNVLGWTGTRAGPDASATGLPADSVVMDTAAGDATHLYAAVAEKSCVDTRGTMGWCARLLRASEDGGRTWQARPMPSDDPSLSWHMLTAIGPRTLILQGSRRLSDASPSPRPPSDYLVPPHVSVDGGATWRPLNKVDTPVPMVPEGGALVDLVAMRTGDNMALVIDPAAARVAPLANQPPIRVGQTSGSTTLWVGGWDKMSRKPAVSISHDRGLTWTTKVFTDGHEGPVRNIGYPLVLAVGADGTAYAWFNSAAGAQIARTTDGGATWTSLPAPESRAVSLESAFVTADGALIVGVRRDRTVEYLASRDGGPLQTVTLSGLPPDEPPVTRAPDGIYFVDGGLGVDDSYDALYLSGDGWTYRAVPVG